MLRSTTSNNLDRFRAAFTPARVGLSGSLLVLGGIRWDVGKTDIIDAQHGSLEEVGG
jgi:hypothetical protein